MGAARPLLGLLALIFLFGGIVLQFLVVLSGLETTPENQIYFLQTSLNGVTGGENVLNPVRWTWLRLCGVDEATGLNANCLPTAADVPFSPVDNFGTATGLPEAFSQHRNYYYYISRIGWAFYVIALFFAVIAIVTGLLALCTRLGAYLSSTFVFLAVGMQAVAASLMTAWVVKGYREFSAAGQETSYGVKAIAFTWATFAAWSFATVLFCIGGTVGRGESYSTASTKRNYFGRKRSTRSRGSFRDTESGRRVKDEYE